MYQPDKPGFGADIGIPPHVVIIGIVGIGWLFAIAGEASAVPPRMYLVAILLIVGALVAAYLLEQGSALGKWLPVGVVVAAIFLGYSWLGMQGILAALIIPVALAGALVGGNSAAAVAGLETGLLFGLSLYPATHVNLAVAGQASIALWIAVGLMYGVNNSVQRLLDWLWDYFQHAQTALEEARNHRAELQQALADLAQATRQLALANERMAGMRQVAEEAQRSKSAFVAKVSHEFRTPLNIIIGLTGLLVESPYVDGRQLPATLVEDLKTIWRNCAHLSSLVNDVLDLSQAEAERLTLQREWVDLGEIVDSAIAVVKPLLQKKQLSLEVIIPPDVPRVYCDRTRMRQVILNLVSNAARFTDSGGISIQMVQRGEVVEVSVTDTGPGIAPADQERIFEPFCQGSDRLWRDRGGSGLGLTISRQFIELHHGRIWLESELSKGTRLAFEIPIAPPVNAAGSPSRWLVEDWVWHERTARPILPDLPVRPRLVVCDEVGGLCAALARDVGDAIELVKVCAAPQAVEALEKTPAHALLLNLADPFDLWPAVDEVRQAAPDTPIIACNVPAQRQAMEEGGARGYLIKPIMRESLLAAIDGLGAPVHRILIVDDDPEMRDVLTRMLTIDGRWETDAAASGAEALDILQTDAPDLVLLDLIMPEMDGREVLRRKAQNTVIRGVPVIIISAQDPFEQSASSQGVLVAMGNGVSLAKLLRLSLDASALLLGPG